MLAMNLISLLGYGDGVSFDRPKKLLELFLQFGI
jgi:hypothetical protein